MFRMVPCRSDGWLLLFPEPDSDTSQAQLMKGERTCVYMARCHDGRMHRMLGVQFLVLQVPAHCR